MERCSQVGCGGPAEVTITFASAFGGPPSDFDVCKVCADVIVGPSPPPHPLYLSHRVAASREV